MSKAKKFEFEGIDYVPERYDGAFSLQCECCDLKVGGKKLCLSRRCDCGECNRFFSGETKYVFKAQNVTEEYRKKINTTNDSYKIGLLEKEIHSLIREKDKLLKEIKELYKENRKLTNEVRKYASLINNVRSSVNALFGENLKL